MQVLSSATGRDAIFSAFDHAVDALERIETLPAIAQRIMAMTSDPDCQLDDLQQVLSADVALSARLMRVANSAAYGARTVNTLRDALVLIGLRDVRRMAVAAALTSTPDAANPFNKAMWRYSLLAACLAEAICRAGKIRDVPDSFLCGLLHDLGTLALSKVRGEAYHDLVGEPGSDDQGLREMRELGFDHCDLGSLVAQSWKLGEEFEYAILLHHTPFACFTLDLPEPTTRAVLVTSLAASIACTTAAEREPSEADLAMRAGLVEALGLSESEMEDALDRGTASFGELERALLGT